MRGGIEGAQILFGWRWEFNMTSASLEQCSQLPQSCCCCCCWFFAARTAAVTRNVFHWAKQPQKLPVPFGHLDSHLIHGCLSPPESTHWSASCSVQPYLHSSPTDRPCYSICSNWLRLAAAMMQLNKNVKAVKIYHHHTYHTRFNFRFPGEPC